MLKIRARKFSQCARRNLIYYHYPEVFYSGESPGVPKHFPRLLFGFCQSQILDSSYNYTIIVSLS